MDRDFSRTEVLPASPRRRQIPSSFLSSTLPLTVLVVGAFLLRRKARSRRAAKTTGDHGKENATFLFLPDVNAENLQNAKPECKPREPNLSYYQASSSSSSASEITSTSTGFRVHNFQLRSALRAVQRLPFLNVLLQCQLRYCIRDSSAYPPPLRAISKAAQEKSSHFPKRCPAVRVSGRVSVCNGDFISPGGGVKPGLSKLRSIRQVATCGSAACCAESLWLSGPCSLLLPLFAGWKAKPSSLRRGGCSGPSRHGKAKPFRTAGGRAAFSTQRVR